MALWLFGLCFILAIMVYALLFDSNGRYSFLITIISVLLIVGFMVINQLLWNLRGKHILLFYKDYLEVKKREIISVFPAKKVNYYELNRFDITHSRENSIGKLWVFGNETLAGKCSGHHFYLASGWRIEDSEKLANDLKRHTE